MNPIFRSYADNATSESVLFLGIALVLFMAVFAAWTWWAYAPSRREAMDAAALLPFDED